MGAKYDQNYKSPHEDRNCAIGQRFADLTNSESDRERRVEVQEAITIMTVIYMKRHEKLIEQYGDNIPHQTVIVYPPTVLELLEAEAYIRANPKLKESVFAKPAKQNTPEQLQRKRALYVARRDEKLRRARERYHARRGKMAG